MNENKYIDQDEKDILESYENDEWNSVGNIEKQKQKHAVYARNTFLKNKRINISKRHHFFILFRIRSYYLNFFIICSIVKKPSLPVFISLSLNLFLFISFSPINKTYGIESELA